MATAVYVVADDVVTLVEVSFDIIAPKCPGDVSAKTRSLPIYDEVILKYEYISSTR